MKRRNLFLFTLLLFLPVITWAQINTPGSATGFPGTQNPNDRNSFPNPNTQNNKTSNIGPQKSGRAALDDSTKQVYGPSTMYYLYESDVLNSKDVKRRIDTTLTLFQRYLFQEKSGFLIANLGNDGTAVRQVFVQSPNSLGTQLGYSVYSPYAFQSDQVRYINSKSPYSEVEYNLGGGGQTRLNFNFARNVDSLWNIGISIQRMVADKVLTDAAFKSGEQSLLGQWGLLLHTNYQSKTRKYRLLGHINYFDQGTNDQGGVKLSKSFTADEALKYTDNTAILSSSSSQSNDKFIKFHIYHEYIGWKGLQLFQALDVESRTVKYRDKAFQQSLADGFYPRTYIQYIQAPTEDSLYNENQWSSYSHQTGLKGIYKQFVYRTYLKQRYWTVYNPLNQSKLDRFENYIGLWLNQAFTKNIDFTAEGEYLLGSDYRLKASFQSPFFQVTAQRISYSPNVAQNWVYNTSYRWKNDFANISMDEIYGGISLNAKSIYFKPGLTIQRISDWVYFDSLATSRQSKEDIGVFRTSVDVGGRWNKFSWFTKVYANTQSGPDLIRMPNLLVDANLALDVQYKKLLYVQFGFDIHHQSGYYADAYQPALQQYHLQDVYRVPAFVQVDPYVTLRINRVRLFFKMSHANYGLLTNNYYTAYLHPAMSRVFGYGVKWLLFD
ncbi:putative porin [Aquirufa rosea]|uniref:Porin n=1 Tax=Aquirufa rosea TaxID=2509241 RepID=A0A4Q1BY37_9BACT|nr:putative porin [Aquirufa rosea]RXK47529.1 hypothetical protein ESB04_09825 [Aquirufa rosea]